MYAWVTGAISTNNVNLKNLLDLQWYFHIGPLCKLKDYHKHVGDIPVHLPYL